MDSAERARPSLREIGHNKSRMHFWASVGILAAGIYTQQTLYDNEAEAVPSTQIASICLYQEEMHARCALPNEVHQSVIDTAREARRHNETVAADATAIAWLGVSLAGVVTHKGIDVAFRRKYLKP